MTMMRRRPPPAAMLTMAGRVSRLSDMMWTAPGETWRPPTCTCGETQTQKITINLQSVQFRGSQKKTHHFLMFQQNPITGLEVCIT